MLPSNISNIFSLMKAQMWNIENIYNLSQMYKVMRTNESRVLYVILFTTSQCIMAKNRYIMFYACDIITLIEGKHDAGFKSSASIVHVV
jgi:hypothetical protein